MRFAHNDLDEAETLLRKHRNSHGLAMVVSESLFSMDGDMADIRGLAALCRRYDAALQLRL